MPETRTCCAGFAAPARALVLTLVLVLAGPAQAGTLDWTLLAERPHDARAYTQGLLLYRGSLWESTGLHGQSSLRRVDPDTGRVLAMIRLPRDLFGEGLAQWAGRLIQLTWTSGRALVHDPDTLQTVGEFAYSGQGWGLTTDGRSLIMSNGTSVLTFRNPDTFAVRRTLAVTEAGRPLDRLNELEWVRGLLLCNIWHEDQVAVVDPATGQVVARLDFTSLRGRMPPGAEVLNGLAYDPESGRLFVTGKFWPALFEVRVNAWPRPASGERK